MLLFATVYGMERRCPSGFTLIELLMVIAICSILAGILFPVFAKARSRAREATALGNLKQIGAALQSRLPTVKPTTTPTRVETTIHSRYPHPQGR